MVGSSQSEILKALLYAPDGENIDALSQQLGISRNATYQHVKTLERDGLIEGHRVKKTSGRPGQTYRLTRAGHATFTQSYSLIASLLVNAVKSKLGKDQTTQLLQQIGEELAGQLSAELKGLALCDRIEKISATLKTLGYEARLDQGCEESDIPEIVAHNCVFHDVAETHPEVCDMDLMLLTQLSGCAVEHRECIVKGGKACRFAFHPTPVDAA